jgi:uncharacterized protein (TIGR00303 family)
MPVFFPDREIEKSLKESRASDIIFILLAGSTSIAQIPGISAAGASSELMKMTPVVDSEIIISGRCLSLKDPPMTPDGIPSPSIITRAALQIAGIRSIVVDAGLALDPAVPFVKSGLGIACDPRKEAALPNYDRALEFGRYVGSLIEGKYSHVIVGESIPGGTTTSYMVLRSAGIHVETSSSLKEDPSDLKKKAWEDSRYRAAPVHNLLESVAEFGDYSMPVALGISSELGSSELILAGGTQMALAGRLIKSQTKAKPYLATTGWVIDHRKSTLEEVFGADRIIRSDISFESSRHEGLRQYDRGHVREGAGMGGAFMISASKGHEEDLYRDVDSLYDRLSQ